MVYKLSRDILSIVWVGFLLLFLSSIQRSTFHPIMSKQEEVEMGRTLLRRAKDDCQSASNTAQRPSKTGLELHHCRRCERPRPHRQLDPSLPIKQFVDQFANRQNIPKKLDSEHRSAYPCPATTTQHQRVPFFGASESPPHPHHSDR